MILLFYQTSNILSISSWYKWVSFKCWVFSSDISESLGGLRRVEMPRGVVRKGTKTRVFPLPLILAAGCTYSCFLRLKGIVLFLGLVPLTHISALLYFIRKVMVLDVDELNSSISYFNGSLSLTIHIPSSILSSPSGACHYQHEPSTTADELLTMAD